MREVKVKGLREEDDYLADRLQEKINSYLLKGDRQKVFYWILACTAGIGAALVPAFINIQGVPDVVPTVTSLVVAVALAIEGTFRPREHWRNYDSIAADLRAEEMRYSTKTGPYADGAAFVTLVQRVEDKIAAERSDTILMRTAPVRNGGDQEDH
ncbi:MAG: DUF4231 domain-containing protein [Acidimicrobiia bacterium]